MNCPRCGSSLADDAKFCTACGATVGSAPPGPAQPYGGAPPRPPMQQQGAVPGGQQPMPGAPGGGQQGYGYPPGQGAAGRQGGYGRTPGGFPFEPLGMGQIFDVGIKIYLGYFKYIIGTAAVVWIPYAFLAFVFGLLGMMGGAMPDGFSIAIVAGIIVLVPVFIVCMALQQGAMIRMISDVYMGNDLSIRRAYTFAGRKLGSLVGGSILYGLIFMAGTLMCLIPGIYVAIALLLYPYIIMLENKGAVDALGRSHELVKGSWFILFVIMFLVGILTSAASMVFQIPVFILSASGNAELVRAVMPFITLGQQLFQVLLYPVGTIFTILVYYDLRIRKEGYDLEILSREILG